MGVDPLDHDGGEVLQLDGEDALDAHDQRAGLRTLVQDLCLAFVDLAAASHAIPFDETARPPMFRRPVDKAAA